MTATACALAVLLTFEAATPPEAKDECELADHRCKAVLYERRSAATTNAEHRALYLFSAHRLYLRLFDKSGDARDLCAARRALHASLAVEGQSSTLRAKSETMRADLVARERQEGADCTSVAGRPRVRKTESPLVARRPAPEPLLPEPPTELLPSPATATALAPEAPPPPARTELLVDLDGRPTIHPEPAADLMPVVARPTTTERPSSPRPGRGLVIAGGVSLGVGVALTAAAGALGRRMVDTRQQIIALSNSVDGFATADQDARDDALRRDFRATGTQTLALAVSGGATLIVAAILASIGGRKMARAASRTALVPAPGGVVFHARF